MTPGSESEIAATEFVRQLIERKAVELEVEPGQDSKTMAQVVAYVHLGDLFLNEHLIEQGYGMAAVDLDYSKKHAFDQAERAARSAGRGIWPPSVNAADVLPSKLKLLSLPDLFERIPGGKSAYTSTDQYRARRAAALPPGTYAFLLHRVTPNFDADRATFVFDLPITPFLSGSGSAYVVTSEETVEGEEVRTNAFGARVSVRKVSRKEFAIAPGRQTTLLSKVMLNVSREEAAAMKGRLRVAILCRLGITSVPDELRVAVPEMGAVFRSGTATGVAHEDATWDDPEDRTVYQYALVADDVHVCIFDRETAKQLRCETAVAKP